MPEKYKRNPNTKCAVCAKPIYKRPQQIRLNKGRGFCSTSCYGVSCRKEIPCIVCGGPILGGLNKKTCSRKCANKNRIGNKYKLKLSRKNIVVDQRMIKMRLLEARGKSCERCGYSKHQILQTHHKDKNRKNNNLSNLELLCPNCHFEKHYLEKSRLKHF